MGQNEVMCMFVKDAYCLSSSYAAQEHKQKSRSNLLSDLFLKIELMGCLFCQIHF